MYFLGVQVVVFKVVFRVSVFCKRIYNLDGIGIVFIGDIIDIVFLEIFSLYRNVW